MNCTRKGSGQGHEFSKGNSIVGYGRTSKTTSPGPNYSTAAPSEEVMAVRNLIFNVYIGKMRQDQILAQNQKPTVPTFFDYAINHCLPEEAIKIMLQEKILAEKEKKSLSLVEVLENLPMPKGKEKEFLNNITSKMPKALLDHYNSDYASLVEQFKPVPLKRGYEFRENKLR